ncbi:MAG TPA: cyclase family protein [Chthonomonadaceae bacterium]|nr:cyclase family protein [Chthonomonadaceae bacterium]
MTIIDISRSLEAATAVWPGDEPFRYTRSWRIADGAAVNLGSITTSLHAGTHVDAPVHFRNGGPTAEQLPLQPFIGPAIVVNLEGRHEITIDDVAVAAELAPRVLIRTAVWPDGAPFPTRFPVMARSVPAYLAGRGALLVGLDLPSVDAFDSKELPNHHALHEGGIQILESLDLDHVPPGRYELVALPLKLAVADASPVRAVLRT